MRLKYLKEFKDFSQPAINEPPKSKSSGRSKMNIKATTPRNKKEAAPDAVSHSANPESSSKTNQNMMKKGQS